MTAWLIDKSALARWPQSPDAVTWLERAERGLVHVTTPTLLEVGYSARSADDWRAMIDGPPVSRLLVEYLTPASERRAIEVQEMLVRVGHHRAPSVPDLLIAAIAELADLTVLHVDKDFELIAHYTDQPVERLRV